MIQFAVEEIGFPGRTFQVLPGTPGSASRSRDRLGCEAARLVLKSSDFFFFFIIISIIIISIISIIPICDKWLSGWQLCTFPAAQPKINMQYVQLLKLEGGGKGKICVTETAKNHREPMKDWWNMVKQYWSIVKLHDLGHRRLQQAASAELRRDVSAQSLRSLRSAQKCPEWNLVTIKLDNLNSSGNETRSDHLDQIKKNNRTTVKRCEESRAKQNLLLRVRLTGIWGICHCFDVPILSCILSAPRCRRTSPMCSERRTWTVGHAMQKSTFQTQKTCKMR